MALENVELHIGSDDGSTIFLQVVKNDAALIVAEMSRTEASILAVTLANVVDAARRGELQDLGVTVHVVAHL